MVFEIAEYTGGLKDKFYELGIPYKKFSPLSVKQFATGKGNAEKLLMGMMFNKLENKHLLDPHFQDIVDFKSPKADIVDSYYMADLLRYEMCYTSKGIFPNEDDSATLRQVVVEGKSGAKTEPTIKKEFICKAKT